MRVFLLLILYFPFSLFADSNVEKNIVDSLSELFIDIKVSDIKQTPVEGLYQVLIGADVIYITSDSRYVFKGELLDIKNKENLTENLRSMTRAKMLSKLNGKDYIEFSAKNQKAAIYVFTDVDCGYCRKLHNDVAELNEKGVSVRYLAYPRAGTDSPTGRTMSFVWCSKNRQKALTLSKNNKEVEQVECDDPISKQHELGGNLGVRGTPAIYLEDGTSLPGYMRPDELIYKLGI